MRALLVLACLAVPLTSATELLTNAEIGQSELLRVGQCSQDLQENFFSMKVILDEAYFEDEHKRVRWLQRVEQKWDILRKRPVSQGFGLTRYEHVAGHHPFKTHQRTVLPSNAQLRGPDAEAWKILSKHVDCTSSLPCSCHRVACWSIDGEVRIVSLVLPFDTSEAQEYSKAIALMRTEPAALKQLSLFGISSTTVPAPQLPGTIESLTMTCLYGKPSESHWCPNLPGAMRSKP